MDARTFIERLSSELSKKIEHFEIHIEDDNCPKSIKYIVLSDEFRDVGRADRIYMLSDIITNILGTPMVMRAVGVCLTKEEYDRFSKEDDEEDLIVFPSTSSDESAAKSI